MIFSNINRDKLPKLWDLIHVNAYAKYVKYNYLPVFLSEMYGFFISGVLSISSSKTKIVHFLICFIKVTFSDTNDYCTHVLLFQNVLMVKYR